MARLTDAELEEYRAALMRLADAEKLMTEIDFEWFAISDPVISDHPGEAEVFLEAAGRRAVLATGLVQRVLMQRDAVARAKADARVIEARIKSIAGA